MINKPPTMLKVWKNSYFKKSLLASWELKCQNWLTYKLYENNNTVNTNAANLVL